MRRRAANSVKLAPVSASVGARLPANAYSRLEQKERPKLAPFPASPRLKATMEGCTKPSNPSCFWCTLLQCNSRTPAEHCPLQEAVRQRLGLVSRTRLPGRKWEEVNPIHVATFQ